MELKQVILWRDRRRAPRGPIPAGGPFAAAPAEASMAEPATRAKVEVAQIPIREAKALARDPLVAAIAPVMPMRLIAPIDVQAGADPLASGSTWGIKAVKADTSPFDGSGIVVAVLDTGIDPNHSAFAGVALVRKNFTLASDDDENGHGTHCAGTIFGRDVNNTRIGVAPGVTRALIGKVLGQGGGGSDVVANAINWAAENGANVISMSLGLDFTAFVAELTAQGVPIELATSLALEGYRQNIALFENLAEFLQANSIVKGNPTLLVAAAGNESQRDINAQFEIAVSPPAAATGVVSVAALEEGQSGFGVARFSNTGAQVSGPGVAVISAKLGGGLAAKSGTSMATPHVAGVAALWAQKLAQTNQLTATKLMARLVGSATQDGLATPFDPDDIGLGIVQAPQV